MQRRANMTYQQERSKDDTVMPSNGHARRLAPESIHAAFAFGEFGRANAMIGSIALPVLSHVPKIRAYSPW